MVEDLTFCQIFSLFENIFFLLRCVFFSFEGFPLWENHLIRTISSVGRAADSYSAGPGFESLMVHQSGPMVKWPKTPASHAGNEGSNPSRVTNICGVYYSEDPPVPIPNTVVKLVCAEDTWRAASRKNRSMPQQSTPFGVLFLLQFF